MSTKTWAHEPTIALLTVHDAPAPGTPEWARTVTASKIPALAGLSSWDSPYSLWAKATGRAQGAAANPELTERGEAIEPALLAWLAGKLGDSTVRAAATYAHPEHEWAQATPDGLVYEGRGRSRRRTPYALVECKTAAHGGEWGEPGTAQIPPAYLAQVAWQMHVTGARTVYVPALVNPGIRLNLWVVRWEDVADTVPALVAAAEQWRAQVLEDTPPALDGLAPTWDAVREMSPDIDPDRTVALDHWDAVELHTAKQAAAAAEERLRLAQARALDAAAGARTLTDPDGNVIATLTARKRREGGYYPPTLRIAA